MKENKHLGVYGLIIEEDKILLIKKATGPYDGKLDLPGGSIKFLEKPEDTLKREIKEETGLEVKKFKLLDCDSTSIKWTWNNQKTITHHIGVFYKINSYEGKILENIKVDDINNDSLGAKFYNIKNLNKKDLSKIAILQLEKLGYKLK